MAPNIKPIFIFSLPRSGSTLLQRILNSHPKIASSPEPWLLLPYVYANKKDGKISEFNSALSYIALNDFISNLPNKEEDYYEELKKFTLNLYRKNSYKEASYFLDKTPRYYFIIPQIAKIFPNAKFIFLFRNPLQIYSSILKTWGNNRFNNLFRNHIDLYEGPKFLTEGYKLLANKSIHINYESFIEHPEMNLKKIMNYLGIEYSRDYLNYLQQKSLNGKLGDQTGVYKYNSIENKQTLTKWKETFKKNTFRKHIIKKYIDGLDEEILSNMGYDKTCIKQEIKNITPHYNLTIIRDLIDYSFSKIVMRFKLNIFFSKSLNWSKNKFIS